MNKKITYGIGFNVDSSGLQQAKQELQQLTNMTFKEFSLVNPEKTKTDFYKIKESAKDLEKALTDSFNPKLNTYNLDVLDQKLKQLNLTKIKTDLEKLGAQGQNAFRNIATEVLTVQKATRQTSDLMSSMFKTFTNTVKWSIASSVLNNFTSGIEKAWGFTKRLDSSLNDIRIVTGKSADEMERFAKQSNKAAKNLGSATTNYTKAALIYYQQGLEEQDVQARANVTVKAANVTGQSASEVSEQLTAVWNGYKVVAEEAELYVDKLAAVAAETAADLEELSTGMSKVASAASTMGVDVDQLSAQLSTIISVTRQDANVVGTALKTIYARMGDLKVDGIDEFGTSLGEVSGQMKQMGIDVLDQQGNLRDMGDVIEEVAAKWGTWTDAQQQAAAVAIAGKRQYNNLIALFENWNMYESAKDISQTSAGTLQKQQEIYMDSLEAKLNKLSTASEKLYMALLDGDSTKGLIEDLAVAVELLADFTEGVGGAGNILTSFGALAVRIFNNNITESIQKGLVNLNILKTNLKSNDIQKSIRDQFAGIKDVNVDKVIDTIVAEKEEELRVEKLLTEEEKKQIDLSLKNYSIAEQKKAIAEENLKNNFKDFKNRTRKTYATNFNQNNPEVNTPSVQADIAKQKEALNNFELIISNFDSKTAIPKLYEQLGFKKNVNLDKKKQQYEAKQKANEQKLKQSSLSKDEKQQIEANNRELTKQIELITKLQNTKIKAAALDKQQNELDFQFQEKYQKILNNGQLDDAQKKKAVKQLIQETRVEYDRLEKEIEQNTEAIKEFNGESKKSQENVKDILNNPTLKSRELISNITNTISNVMALSSTFSMLSGMVETFSDTTASATDKITAGISSIGSSALTIAPMITQAIQGIQAGTAVAGGWVTIAIAAVTVAASIITGIIKSLPKSKSELEKAQEAFDKAQSSAKEAKEILNDLRVEYKNLFDEIEKYDNARLAIDDMRAGTEEWKLAVQELNYELLDTIEKYPILADYLKSNNEYGIEILSLEEGAWDAALKSQQDKISKQQMTTAYSNVSVIKNQADLLQEQYYNQDVKKWAGDADRALGLYATDLRDSSKIALYIGAADKDTEEWSSGTQDFAERRERAYKDLFDMDSEGSLANTLRSDYGGNLAYIDAELDLTKLMDKSVIELQTLQDNIQANTDLTDQEKTALIDLIGTTKETKESIDRNTEQLKKAEYDFYKQVAEEKGINSTVFANVASKTKSPDAVFDEDGEDDDLIRANSGSGKNATLRKIKYDWETKQYVLTEDGTRAATDKGEKIETKIQAEEVAGVKKWIDSIVQPLFGENVKPDDYGALSGVETANLMSHKISVQGSEYTIGALINMTQAALALQMASSQQEDLISAMQTAQQRGQLEESVYFDERWYDPNFQWAEGTLDKYNQIINQAEGKTQENAETEKQNFISRIEKQFAKTGIELFSTDENGNKILNEKFNYLTEDQSKILSKQILQADFAGANGAIAQLINSITDPQQMADAVAAISKVTNWNDASQISDLRLALHDIGIEITDDNVWNNFFEKISSGMNKWIQNAKKVSETLAFIRDTVADINFGDVIDDETYKQIIEEYPEAVTKFIKTAEGWISLVDGKALSTEMRGAYDTLQQVTEKYNIIRGSAGKIAGNANINEKIATPEGLQNTFENLVSQAGVENLTALVTSLGYDQEKYSEILDNALYGTDVDEATRLIAQDELRTIVSSINQAAIDVAEGRYTSEEARELYATAVAGSWDQVKNSGALVDDENDETNKKIIAYWGNKFREEIGVGFNWGQELGVDELEELAQIIHKRELDYYGEVSNKLDLLDKQLENAFGENKITLLKRQGSLNRENLEIAEKTYNRESALYEKIISDNSIFAGLLDENGELDISKALDRQAEIGDAEDAEYKTIQAAMDASNAMNEAYVLQKEYVNAALDAQIEAFNYSIEMQKQFLEMKNLSQEIKRNFEDWTSGSLKVFDDKTVQEVLKDNNELLKQSADSYGNFVANVFDKVFKVQKYGTKAGQLQVNLAKYKYSYETEEFDEDGNAIYETETNTNKFASDVEGYLSDAHSQLEEMTSLIQEMYDAYFQAQEELMELFDSQIDRLSKLNSVLGSSVNLWKLINVNSEKSAKTISAYYKAMESNTKESYELSLGKLAVAQEEYDKLFIIAEDGARRLKESISNEMVETVRENLQAATDEVVAAASEWMDIISKQYNEELSAIINDFMKKATGMDLTELTEDWNLYKEREDFYLDDINSAYSIDEIERNFKKSIDETDNLAAQNKMKKVMEEQLKILREKDKLSQYDLDRANAMYELTLKQIALEEAQQTASKMKLTRDASGNYSYQYVSDMDEIAKAEEELAKAQNDLYNLDKERNTSLVEDYYAKMKEAEQAIAEARAANDSARVEALQNAYFGPGGVLDSIKNELGLAEENLAEMSQKLTGNDDFVHSLSEYTNAIAMSDLGQLAESIRELTEESFKLTEHITIDAAGNEVIVSTLDELFGKDSILTSAIAAIKESVVDDKSTLDIDTKSLQESSSAILTEVPKLVSSVGTLSEKLQQYVNVYTEWLGKQVGNSSEIGQNTEALIGLRTSIDGLSNRIDNVKVSGGDSDSSGTNLDLYD